MRGLGRYTPWCITWLLLGCQGVVSDLSTSARFATPQEEKKAHDLEIASIRVWSESRPSFPGVTPAIAARAWERNLRSMDVKAKRKGDVVNAVTSEGQAFRLTFWEEKHGSRGEITWLPPEGAGAGLLNLVEWERKNRLEKGKERRGS